MFEDYEGSSELEVSKSKGGVVDMRNGGSVRMAKGGQAAASALSQLEEEEEERKSREAAEGFASKFLPKKNKRDLATQMAALRRKG